MTRCWHRLQESSWLAEQRCGDAPSVWTHMFTSLCSQSLSACPRWLVLCFQFLALHACQRACQLLYLLDTIKVFFIVYLLYSPVSERCAFIDSLSGDLQKKTHLMQTVLWGWKAKKKKVRRGKCTAVLKRLKQKLFFFFFWFFCCCSSASRRDYGFNRHVFTRSLNLKCEPGVWGNFKQWQAW